MKEVIGNFKLLGKIGEGGMGNVFRGRDLMLERDVAIKSLRPELATNAEVVERFRTEAIALARLQHQNIASVFSFFAEDGQYYMVMEFVDGEPLNRMIQRRGALPWAEAVALLVQALRGLEHAHHAGVVHRDLKPSNMIVATDGTLKLMDFGIARILEKVGLTRTGFVVGTLLYVSPEQVRGGEVDARSDLYSLAVVLYELLTGQVPFDSGSEFELMRAHIEQAPPPPTLHVADLPAALEAIVLHALAKDPAARFQSAESFRLALEHLLASEGPVADERTVLLAGTPVFGTDTQVLGRTPVPGRMPDATVRLSRLTVQAAGPAPAPAAPAAPGRSRLLPLFAAGAGAALVGLLAFVAWRALQPTAATAPAQPAAAARPAAPVSSALPAPAAPMPPVVSPPPNEAPAVLPAIVADPPPAAAGEPAPGRARGDDAPVAAIAPMSPPAATAAPRTPEPLPPPRIETERKPAPRVVRSETPPAVAPASAPARTGLARADGRCARLVQQLSLGERLGDSDLTYLRENCGN